MFMASYATELGFHGDFGAIEIVSKCCIICPVTSICVVWQGFCLDVTRLDYTQMKESDRG